MPIEIIILYICDKILEHFIQEEVWHKRIWYKLFPPKTYNKRLKEIIDTTIDEYEINHPYDETNEMYPFYHSQVLFEKLSLFILFNDKNKKIEADDFRSNPNIKIPTQQEIEDFYDVFINKIKNDDILKNKYLDENYKKQIFETANIIEDILAVASSIKEDTTVTRALAEILFADKERHNLTPLKIFEALNAQVNRQLTKQINSGKYLPQTFIETGPQKDHLRYLCDSIFYSEKCFEEINIMDFRHLNNILKIKKHPEFNLDFVKFNATLDSLNINNSYQIFTEWFNHVVNKQQEIRHIKIDSNEKSKFEYKFNDRINDLAFLKARVALITETAGQGKTNFLCDFTENFLLKRNIPIIFMTGVEINASDIRSSILKRIFPDSPDYTFQDFLDKIKSLCHEQNKFFVVIIDGINENINAREFSQNLEIFISELLEYDFIKIVLSCRTEYYQYNFINLEQSSFATEIQKITNLLPFHHDHILKEKLFHIYFDYFKINCKYISEKAYDQLVENFLLLRIFCESYQNQNIDFLDNIYKEEVFESYYTLKSEEINERLRENDEFRVTGSFDIKYFISNIIELMIQSKSYVNVPLDEIIKEPKDKQMYIRFLDENILVKRDIQVGENNIFKNTDVVNFTFDEFRDFMLSRYLIEVLYKTYKDKFIYFIENQIKDKSPILEGCSTFLFFISRRYSDEALNNIISQQTWFRRTFSKCIFSLKDSQVTATDKDILKEIIINNSDFSELIIFKLISRNNTEFYKNLNIDFLFELLREYDDQQYMKNFSSKFVIDRWGNSKINQETLLNQISEMLEQEEISNNTSLHKLFELLIYMFTNNNYWRIQSIYEKYFFRHKETGANQLRLALNCKNENLNKKINQFISQYEINL